jgi:hypothetical protein
MLHQISAWMVAGGAPAGSEAGMVHSKALENVHLERKTCFAPGIGG